MKSSYTRSYSRYPRKKRGFGGEILRKNRTNVLLRTNKVFRICKLISKTIDISNVKKWKELSKIV